MKIARYIGFTVGLSLGLAASTAAAQRREIEPESQDNRVGLEFDWHHTGVSNTASINVLTWDLLLQIAVTPNLYIDGDISWAFASFPGTPDRGAFGNPLVGLHYADTVSRVFSFFVGGGLGIPVNASPSTAGLVTDAYVASLRAFADAERFAPRSFPLKFRGGIEISSAPLFARFDLAPSVLVGLSGADTAFVIDQSNEVGLRARYGLLGGLRLQENFILTDTNDGDQVQLALEPFIGFERNGPGLYLRLGLLFALDGTQGFGFDRGKDSVLRFSIGGKF